MKAVILAAGEGTRLAPLTNTRPKPMLPVANKPILEYVIEAVAEAGIDDVVLVVGYQRNRIRDHFGDGDDWGVDLEYVVQQTQLGSGHALLQAERTVGSDVVVLNGDQILDASAIEAVIDKRAETGDAVLAATRSPRTDLYGVVAVDGDRVTDLQEKPPEAASSSELINAGVYAFGPEIFALLRETEGARERGLTASLKRYLDDHSIRVVPYDGSWCDVSWPWELLTINGSLLDEGPVEHAATASIHDAATVVDAVGFAGNVSVRPNATVLRGTSLGENVSVGANAVVENAVVMPDAAIGAGAVVRDVIVGANATVGPGSIIEGGETDVVIGDERHRGVRFGGIIGDNAVLGGGVTVAPGTRLGDGSDVESGARLDGRFESDSVVRRG